MRNPALFLGGFFSIALTLVRSVASAGSLWKCVSVDKAGKTWYWASPVKSTAIANARTACLHNSTVGGCRVSPGYCSAS